MTTVRTAAILLMSSLMSMPAVAQTSSPPPLDYAVVPDSFSLPAGMTFGGTSGVAINSKGHIFVLVATPEARPYVRMVIERLFATLPVLSHLEIARGIEIKSLGTIS